MPKALKNAFVATMAPTASQATISCSAGPRLAPRLRHGPRRPPGPAHSGPDLPDCNTLEYALAGAPAASNAAWWRHLQRLAPRTPRNARLELPLRGPPGATPLPPKGPDWNIA